MEKRKWVHQEVELLRHLYPTTNAKTIGTKLGRTRNSVMNKAGQLKLKVTRRGNGNIWSVEELEKLRSLYTEHVSPFNIAKQLGRSRSAIATKITQLNLCNPHWKLIQMKAREVLLADGFSIKKTGRGNYSYDYLVEKENILYAVNVKSSDYCMWSKGNINRLFSEGVPLGLWFTGQDWVYIYFRRRMS